jgi:chromosome segregation ATPase
MTENDETTKRLSSEQTSGGGHTIEDVFRLVVSMNDRLIGLEDRFETHRAAFEAHRSEFEAHRSEFTEFRDRVDSRLLKMTTPLSETLDAIRGDIRQVTERMDDLNRITRKIEGKVSAISTDMYAIKADLHDHERRLEALEPQ